MTILQSRARQMIRVSVFVIAIVAPALSMADADDPPSRVARLAYEEGAVSMQPSGTEDWVEAPINRPLTTGDKLWSDRDGRIELQSDGSLLRLSHDTSISILNLDDNVTQIQLTQGTLLIRVRRLDDAETYEIDTPNLAFSVLRTGFYKVHVDESGNTTIRIDNGQGEVTGGGAAFSLHAHESDTFSGSDLSESAQNYAPNEDDFDYWSAGRDSRYAGAATESYVSPDVVGYEDLDANGDWRATPEYAHVWFPRGLETGWAPYHRGHWSYIAPWGYTWVDDQPWGFAPFHYGRWVSIEGNWGWIPSPPRSYGAIYVRPVYAPALVAWVGAGAGVAWFALGPREVYVPSYPVSHRYVNDINISNTRVNTTVINNVYNTTIVNNRTVNVSNITYANRNVPGAVAATTTQAFANAQPVARNIVKVDGGQIRAARVQATPPAVVPTKQGVLGAQRVATARPSEALQTRAVVARTPPPASAPSFENRQTALRNNRGRPLSVAELHTIQPGNSPTTQVRLAPPATPLAARPERPQRPTVQPALQAARPPVHASELPQPPRPASPSIANSALERQHLQEQQQLHAQQAAEQQRVQQQQAAEHAQLQRQQQASQNAERQRALEQQHQQQTAALAQQREQAQRELQEKQQEQRRQQEAKTKPATRSGEPPPRP